MKKLSLFLLIILTICISNIVYAETRTVQATFSWNGQDTNSAIEKCLPVIVNLYENITTPVLKSTISINSSVTNQVMPTFTIEVPDNQSLTFNYFATATDCVGNISERSLITTLTVIGNDTVAPGRPIIIIRIP